MPDFGIASHAESDGADQHTARLETLAARLMAGEEIAPGTELTLVITDDAALHDLNRRFRGKDAPTDVLSFPEKPDDFPSDGPGSVGEIFISLPTATRQAESGGVTLEAELDHLLVHGLLHLCGYDHETGDADEAAMLAREEHYLGDLTAFHGS